MVAGGGEQGLTREVRGYDDVAALDEPSHAILDDDVRRAVAALAERDGAGGGGQGRRGRMRGYAVLSAFARSAKFGERIRAHAARRGSGGEARAACGGGPAHSRRRTVPRRALFPC